MISEIPWVASQDDLLRQSVFSSDSMGTFHQLERIWIVQQIRTCDFQCAGGPISVPAHSKSNFQRVPSRPNAFSCLRFTDNGLWMWRIDVIRRIRSRQVRFWKETYDCVTCCLSECWPMYWHHMTASPHLGHQDNGNNFEEHFAHDALRERF